MKTLLVGIQKTGNTWVRFVIFNYFNILNHNSERTLTFNELQEIHLKRMVSDPRENYNDEFPLVFHTHYSYEGHGIFDREPKMPEYFKKFDKVIYIYRNPYDTMLSYWHYIINRDEKPYPNLTDDEFSKLKELEGFVRFYLPRFIHHVETTMHRANLVLDYDKLRINSYLFKDAIKLIIDEIDDIIFKKAIELSCFKNIKDMSIEEKQPYGLGGKHFLGFFCRDGRSGQYKEVMSKELINYIKVECKKRGLDV